MEEDMGYLKHYSQAQMIIEQAVSDLKTILGDGIHTLEEQDYRVLDTVIAQLNNAKSYMMLGQGS